MKITRYGFTGTRHGMTKEQSFAVSDVLCEVDNFFIEFHHGCCVGADLEAHNIARGLGIVVHGHPGPDSVPPIECVWIWPVEKHLIRNRRIVESTDKLIAVPNTFEEVLRSGTWSTIRYAMKLDKPVIIIFPDGSDKRRFF